MKCVLRFALLILHNGPGTGSNSACKRVEAYTTAFRTRLLECTDVDDSEAVRHFISGLKTEPRNWVCMMIGNESPALQHAAQIAERYDNTHNR